MPKSVLITGCSRGGFGEAMAKVYRAKGLQVFATLRNITKIGSLADYDGVQILELDVTSVESIHQCAQTVAKHTGGRLDVLVNNAGVNAIVPLLDASLEEAKKAYDTNVWSIVAMVQAFAPMLIQAEGVVCNISSVSGEMVFAWAGIYSSSRSAGTRISETLRLEMAPLGVRVVTVILGGVQTSGNDPKNIADLELPPSSHYRKITPVIDRHKKTMVHPNKQNIEIAAKNVVDDLVISNRQYGNTKPSNGTFKHLWPCLHTLLQGKVPMCVRLKRKCQPSESVRRRHGPVAEGSDTRISRLEEKMENLLAAMHTFVSSSGSCVTLADTTRPGATSIGALMNMTSSDFSARLALSNATVSTHPNSSLQASSSATSPTASLLNQEEGRLEYFRTRMLPYFPFIDLPPEMTTQYLRQNRPFLLRAIYTVTTFSTQEKLAQVEELKHLLFTSALLKVESSIDMLLGLLTYIAWSTDTFLGRADLVSRLMMLAISLVYDLRLFKPSPPDVQVMMAISQGQAEDPRQGPNAETLGSLSEGRRAVLACFVLSSNLSSHLGRQDALNWTPQMEEALHMLTLNGPCPTDNLFVLQVRLQLFKQKAENVRQRGEVGCTRTETDPATVSLPHLLYFKMLRRQLQELRSSFQADLDQTGCGRRHGGI
ncbi:hypothetical protein BDV39DRAFT_215154 [Aspergillus sergii]|uniref:Uncharacterized protein n=1 Tax=Aspergillus sergii TaxID=1034303 RepID=A0A5N6X1X3_9EURO|nr:hypothetical protein BDV39DRAFT_215154 [Aspergillus sergii]